MLPPEVLEVLSPAREIEFSWVGNCIWSAMIANDLRAVKGYLFCLLHTISCICSMPFCAFSRYDIAESLDYCMRV